MSTPNVELPALRATFYEDGVLLLGESIMNINPRADWLKNTKPLLTTNDLSLILGITPNHIYRLVSQKRIPSIKIGKYRRYKATDILLWIEERAGGLL